MSHSYLRNSVEWALMVALVFGAGAFAQAQDQGKEPKGHIVQIGPDNTKGANSGQTDPGDQATATPGDGQQTMPAQPRYWIGLMGGPIPAELRAHLDVPENQGVMVRSVVPDSPAAKAGVKNFDIVLRANDADLHDMRDLMELVKTAGDQKASISLEVLRKGSRETVTVTPGERPAHVALQQPIPGQDGQEGGMGAMPGMPNDMMQLFRQFGGGEQGQGGGEQGGGQFAFRQFGPGVVVNGMPRGGAAIPNGVSVTVQKQGNEPAHVTIKRGNESWEVVGDDAESFKQLPEDLQPFVRQMLGQSNQGFGNFNLPVPPQGVQGMMPQMGGDHEQDLQSQLDEMKQQLKELEQRLGPPSNHSSDAK